MDWIGGVVLVFMMLLTVADVILRYLGRPILGTYELVSLAGAVVIGCAMPHTSWGRIHVSVDMMLVKMQKRRQQALQFITRVIGFLLFIIIGVNLFDMGTTLIKTGESTLTLVLPLYPIAYLLALCCFAEAVILLSQIFRLFSKETNNE
jgi:TRAP-type C4-dicarboxylate transport system permease small subunit